MFRPRIIPCLLFEGERLVKTVKFTSAKYVGDPINAVKILNEKEVDELVALDIGATRSGRGIQFALVSRIAGECFMPLCYGGGVRTLEDIDKLVASGVEKVAINASAIESPSFVESAAKRFGSQSIVISVDVKQSLYGKFQVFTRGATVNARTDVLSHAKRMENAGAGELFVNSINRDGTRAGYDLKLIDRVASEVSIPVIACGGAGCLQDLKAAIEAGASAAAAGSLFVFHGKYRAVLITYPSQPEIAKLVA